MSCALDILKKSSPLYMMAYYLAIKNNEILLFATTWMDLEDIMLSEISQSEKDQIPYDITHMWNLKNKTNEQQQQKATNREIDSYL